MSAESERFRMRASHCRELARAARDEYARNILSDMAVDLDAEADRIEADGARQDRDQG